MSTSKQIKLTKLQVEELRHRVEVRKDTVDMDSESGDVFENTPGALDALLEKLKPGIVAFTPEELAWASGEAENMADIAAWNASKSGEMEFLSLTSSMNNLCGKLA